MAAIFLPAPDGSHQRYTLGDASPYPQTNTKPFGRVAYAAAHVVTDRLASGSPWSTSAIDIDQTLAFRRHLWSLGFRVAEVMDTAQRGMGLGWADAQDIMRRSVAEARGIEGADLACGVGTDNLAAAPKTLDAVRGAYEEQFAFVEGLGTSAILMASPALAALAKGPDDYAAVYGRLLEQSRGKVILHWLGEAFDPRLAGYWGFDDRDRATDFVLDLIEAHADKIDGIKVSLLDASHEIAMRARLPAGVVMYTGDDFNYPELIAGDATAHSHALLGIFDPIAPAAAAALVALGEGDNARFHEILDPTLALARHVFEAPTQYYKAGVVFLAWLNGHQEHFSLLGGMESARSALHYSKLFELADKAKLLRDPDLAAARMTAMLGVNGLAA